MQQNEGKNPLNKPIYKYRFHLLCFLIGILIGVISCNWSYFILDNKISVPQILTVIISGGIAIYLGSTIQSAFKQRESRHSILNDEIKRLLIYLEKLGVWLEDLTLPFEESKRYFKRGTINILSNKKIFAPKQCREEDFTIILNLFNKIKQSVLSISPENGLIKIPEDQIEEFEKDYQEVREDLLMLLYK